CLQSGYWPHSF
nr:immunoglobulin light chain junction region [Macaca mulatta]MOV61201.1 immunoglobulin light chain junction region [Macaca mulatta]MOV61834.1 immunoglobulin light chain junction region [Macaca mulatta]MOV61868.1 immunoglobulin light chain junction region [Macaca mulatta]MOV62051.1 immunoglobulin light chain junction region [Macaca mulatta]